MNVSRGKDFESLIESAFKREENTSVLRLHDVTNGYSNVNNPCDYIVYNYPTIYYLECKTCYGNTLPLKNIRDNQWNGLLSVSDIKGVVAGYMIWFISHDRTIFISAKDMKELKESGAKSVNINSLPKHFNIDGKKKRVFFDYDMKRFLKEYGSN